MHFVRSAALAVCLIAASSSIAAPFPQATSSQVDLYQDFSSKEKCAIENDCGVNFSAITGSRVLIVHVSCSFGLKTGDSVIFASLGAAGQTAVETFPVTKTTDVTGGTAYVINAQTYLFFDKGKVPGVGILTAKLGKSVENLRCTISGYHA